MANRSRNGRVGGGRRGWGRSSGASRSSAAGLGTLCLVLGAFASTLLPGWSCSVVEKVAGRDPAPTRVLFREEPDIRVRIIRAADSTVVEAPGRVYARVAGAGEGQGEFFESPLTVRARLGCVVTADRAGRERQWPAGAEVELLGGGPGTATPRDAQTLRVAGVPHPGFVAVRPGGVSSAGGAEVEPPNVFDVLSVQPIEDYLPGVLAKELYSHWPRGAFEAQAVTARTYAIHERARARRVGRPFDVESTTADQVYGGVTSNARALDAASATRGVVLRDGDEILRAYYSSTCGGRPGSASRTWPTGPGFEFNLAAPIQGRPRDHWCQGSTLYRWEVTRGDDELSRRMRTWGAANGHAARAVGRVRSVQAVSRNKADRPDGFRVTDDAGREFVLSGEEFRLACNTEASGLPAITRQTRVNSSDVEAEVKAGVVTIRGRGFGHGVGMCQWCAKAMAERGTPWREMLTTFYPGATIEKVY